MDFIFVEVSLIIILAAILGIIAKILRQPAILGFILAGVIVGPLGLVKISNPDILDLMARLGITLLLFMVGLELSLKDLKTVGRVAFIAGIGQVVFTTILGFFIATLLGFNVITSFYISIALTFSSTIIIVKLLSDKKDLNSLYGKISMGMLLVQDFVAIAILILLSGFSSPFYLSLPVEFLLIIGKSLLLFTVVFILSIKFFPRIVDLVARSQELLFLVSIAWAVGMAALVSSPFLGFSIEIGGLLAGIALANSSEHFQIAARVKPLRDFFITLFFVILGMKMITSNISSLIIPSLVFSFFVLIGNPIIVMTVMGFLGYRKRTSFFTGLTMAQISEFSLILVILAHKVGHLSSDIVSMITFIAIITFTISTYMILYNNKLYQFFSPYLGIFERKQPLQEQISDFSDLRDHIILVGANRMGKKILEFLAKNEKKVVVVDFNPDIIKTTSQDNIHTLFGDISDPEVLERVNSKDARLVISTVPDFEDNIMLLNEIKKMGNIKFIATADDETDAKRFYQAGADFVIIPHQIGGQHIATLLQHGVF